MKTEIEVVTVAVTDLRKDFRLYFSQKKPLVVERSGTSCAVILSARDLRYKDDETVVAEWHRCLDELRSCFAAMGAVRF